MKKPRAVVKIENLEVALREKVEGLLDDHTDPVRIAGDLRGNHGVEIAPSDIEEFATWRGIAEAQPGADAEPQRPETRYTPETLTREHITYAIKEKVVKLIEEARKDPSSDATKLIEALLLQAMTNEELGTAEQDLKTVFELQRKNKDSEHRYKNEHSQRRRAEKDLQLKEELFRANIAQIKAKTEALARVARVTDEMQ